ncbi:uncharacterized protein LOC141674769 [Apium graveolens]|uniref:uncharacterized protein LOC141674769 n=1 Tax=Apium graveolens TaxID=4045 RepID=UPI003D7AA3BE
MACNSTDEEEVTFPVFNPITDMKDPEFQLGMLFPNAKIFRAAVRKQAIMHRRPIKICRNYGIRVRFICEKPCEWKIYASKMNSTNTYQIKVYNPKHTCTATFYQKQINSRWIAEHYEDEIRINPTWPLAAFLKKVVNDWHCHVSVYAIARAKKKVLDNINGKHVDQYGRVWEYGEQILKVMPQSTVQIMTEDQELAGGRKRFKRMYIYFGPPKMGFKNGCRPLLGLDGCHLKGPYGGQLLAAVATDANDGMYPLVWAVGLINALEAVFPNVEHRLCVMHLYRNMWKEHKGIGVRMYLWLAARVTTDYTFNKHMQEMKKLSRKYFEWLSEKPRSQWSRSAFRNLCRIDMFVNNHCEVFNSTIGKCRDLPIIFMLKAIHNDVMVRIQKRRDKMLNSYALNPVCHNAMRRLNKAINQALVPGS